MYTQKLHISLPLTKQTEALRAEVKDVTEVSLSGKSKVEGNEFRVYIQTQTSTDIHSFMSHVWLEPWSIQRMSVTINEPRPDSHHKFSRVSSHTYPLKPKNTTHILILKPSPLYVHTYKTPIMHWSDYTWVEGLRTWPADTKGPRGLQLSQT